MKTSAILLIVIFLTSSVALCLADENKDHVCFRVLDLNKDGKLTHDEYHNILGHGSS